VTVGVFLLLVPIHGAGSCEKQNLSQWNNQFLMGVLLFHSMEIGTTSQQASIHFLRGKKHHLLFSRHHGTKHCTCNLFRKPSVSFYLMAIVVIVDIHWECIIPVALFNWSVVTY
jgi:hypothetical protein